jgi:hypothetical protein
LAIRVVNIFAPKNENYFIDLVLSLEEILRGSYRDLGCFWNWWPGKQSS